MKYTIFLACVFTIAVAQLHSTKPLAGGSIGLPRPPMPAPSSGSGSIGLPRPPEPAPSSGSIGMPRPSSGSGSIGLPRPPTPPPTTPNPGTPGSVSGMASLSGAITASGGNLSNMGKIQTSMAILTGHCNSITLMMINGQLGDDLVKLYQCRCVMRMPSFLCFQMSGNMLNDS